MKALFLSIALLFGIVTYGQTIPINNGLVVTKIDLRQGHRLFGNSEICTKCALTFVARWNKDTVLLKCVRDTIDTNGFWASYPCENRLDIGDFCILPSITWNKIVYDGVIQIKREREEYQKMMNLTRIQDIRDSINRIKLLKLIK